MLHGSETSPKRKENEVALQQAEMYAKVKDSFKYRVWLTKPSYKILLFSE